MKGGTWKRTSVESTDHIIEWWEARTLRAAYPGAYHHPHKLKRRQNVVIRFRTYPNGPYMEAEEREEKRLRVYIAGPITGIPSHNRAAFAEAECALRNLGYDVFNPTAPPHETYPDFDINAPRSVHLRRDMIELARADVMYLLPGWYDSFAGGEKEVAEEIGMPVFYRNGRFVSCNRIEKP